MEKVSCTSRAGRLQLHSHWRWTRQEGNYAANHAQIALVRHLTHVEAENQDVRIVHVGSCTIEFILRKPIPYDGAYQKIKRMLRLVAHTKKPFKKWKIAPVEAPGGSNATSMVVDPQHTQQSMTSCRPPFICIALVEKRNLRNR